MIFEKNMLKSDSLFHNIQIMALTATASIRTREHIMVNLNMKDNYLIVCQLPNRVNICYQVYERPSDPVVAFLPFLNDMIQQKPIDVLGFVRHTPIVMRCTPL